MIGTVIWPTKTPTEVKDFGIIWDRLLKPGEIIMTSTWSSTEGILVQSQGLYGTDTTVVWLSGGITGKTYKFLNRIGTSQGRLMEAEASLNVKAR
jgi:hypothetical protein